MAKILQWLLAATLLTNGAILLYYFFGVSLFLWNADSPGQEKLKGSITWNYQYKTLLKEYSKLSSPQHCNFFLYRKQPSLYYKR